MASENTRPPLIPAPASARKLQVKSISMDIPAVAADDDSQPTSAKTKTRTPPATLPGLQLLTQYFRFGYFLQLLPYKIVPTGECESGPGPFTIQSSTRQKISCALTTLMTLYTFLSYARQPPPPHDDVHGSGLALGAAVTVDEGAMAYKGAVLVANGLNVLHKAVFLCSFWTNQARFLEMFQEIRGRIRASTSGNGIRTFSIFLCVMYLSMTVLSTFGGIRLGLTLTEWTPTNFVMQSVQFMRFIFYMKPAPAQQLPTSTDYALCVIQVVIQFWSQLTLFYSDLCIHMCIFTYAWVCLEYKKTIKQGFGSSEKTILEVYADLKVITDRINQVGTVIFAGYLLEMLYGIVHMTELLQDTDWLPKLRFLFFMTSSLVVLFAASWANNQVEWQFLEWIADSRNAEQLTGTQLVVLTNELNRHRVGISGGFATITYSFTGTAIGMVITYAVIVLQLKK